MFDKLDKTSNNIQGMAGKLHARAIYAMRIYVLWQKLFSKEKFSLINWGEDRDKKYRSNVLNLIFSAVLRSLYIELCVIFDPPNKKLDQYNIASILAYTDETAIKTENKVFKRPKQIKEVDCLELTTICHLDREIIDLSDRGILSILQVEYTKFKEDHEQDLTRLRYVRDRFLVHADEDYLHGFTREEFIRTAVMWVFSYSSLLLQLMELMGTRHYVRSLRDQLIIGYENENDKFLEDVIGN